MKTLRNVLFLGLLLALPATTFAQARMLKVSTAVNIRSCVMVLNTDGDTAQTGLTLSQADVRLSKNYAAYAQKGDTSTATHLEGGVYSVPLNTTDTNTLGPLDIYIHESGALACEQHYFVVPSNVYDCYAVGSCFQTIKRAVAFANYVVWMYNSSNSPVTGLTTGTITCKISKDGGASATTNDTTETELSATDFPGAYLIDLTSTETTADIVLIRCSGGTGTAVSQFTPVH